MNHCHAAKCNQPIKDDLLMCVKHWYMVPQVMRSEVWAAYASGNGIGTTRHILAITAAINYVAVKEGHLTKEEGDTHMAKVRETFNAT